MFDDDTDKKQMKDNIRMVVQQYKQTFPDEYKKIKKTLKDKRGQIEIEGNEWAEIEGMEAAERHVFDIPHTLYSALVGKLSETTLNWLYARNGFEEDFSGVKWFMTEFSEFNVSKEY